MSIEARRREVAAAFEAAFGRQPTVWVQAPGRVDLMGSHTDYNEGFVLTQAIDRNTWIAASPREDRRVSICSMNVSGCADFSLDDIQYDGELPWSNYVRGVAAVLQGEGYRLRGFDGLIHSDIPFGSGLSSSAALEAAAAVLFEALSGLDIDPVLMARLCQRAENEFVGMNCGILDQYSSIMGEAGAVLQLDCRSITSETKPIAPGIQVVICDTRAERALTGSEYPERRHQCEEGARILARAYPEITALRDATLSQLEAQSGEMSQLVAMRCRFVIEENQRVLEMSEALAQGDLARVGRLTAASYAGARDLYQIISPEMAQMMAAMASGPGLIGGRQAGAGFGGCLVALVADGSVEAFARHVSDQYHASTGITPQVYPVKAAAGAGRLPFD